MAFDGPRLRRDLVSTILQSEDGVRCVDVHDPIRGSTFRLFGYEYSVALAFDGRPLAKVIAWVRLSTGLELTVEQLTAFADRLDQLGFLVSGKVGTPGVAPEEAPAPIPRTTSAAAQTKVPAPLQPEDAKTPVPVISEPAAAKTPVPVISEPEDVKTPVPVISEPAAAKTPVPVISEPEDVKTPVPVISEPAAAKTPVPVISEPEDVKTPVPVISEPAAAKTPVPVISEPAAVKTPVPVISEPAAAKTPVPVISEPAAVKTPVPVISEPEPVDNDAPTPGPAFVEPSPAAESHLATAESEPSATEAASGETPSWDALPMAEPPAVAIPQPDLLSQTQPSLPAADATPAPVELPPAPPVIPPAQEPLSVPLETLPSALLDETPPPIPLEARTPPPLRERPPRSRMYAGETADGTGRPRTVRGETRMLTPGPRGMTPPPLVTPRPFVTPAYSRSATGRGGPWILYALLGTLAALVVGTLVVPLVVKTQPPAAVRTRVLVAKPTAVLRWFDGTAPVEKLPSEALSFPAGGKVIRIVSPGISLRAGDVVAATDAARSLLADLARLQERLAYFEQLAGATPDTGDEKRASAARTKVELSVGLVEQTQTALSRVAVVAQGSVHIEATLATLGQTVRAGAPAVRLRSAGWRASFELPRTQVARVRKQGFCMAEIEGRSVACSLAPDGGDETHVVIELAPEAATAAGQPAHLARARLADAYLVPASALSRVGDSDRVLLVAPTGRAEARSVAVADRTAADAVITQGLDPGDAVIVESSEPVAAGARVWIAGAMRE
jgi:hypothetical protein